LNDLEQLALDVRAEKQLWKEAAQRAERKVVARKPTSGMASVPEGDIISQPIGGWSRSKACTGEGPFLQAHVSLLPCLAEQHEGEDRERATGTPADRSSPEELLGEGCSDISDIVFADPSDIAEVEGALLTPPLANMRSPLLFSLPASPPALGRPRPDSMHTLKEYPSISTMVFADREDTELDPDVPEEPVSATPRSRPTLRRVVRRIDFEECRGRRAVIVQTPSTPPHLDLNTTAAPQHLPFCFESFGYMASFLLGIPQPNLGSERPTSKSTCSEAHPTSSPSSLLAWETERARMEDQIINLTAQLNDAVEEIRDLLTQLHQTQDDMLLSKRETAARVEGLERDIKVLNYEAQVTARANQSLCAENECLRLASLHNFTTGVHPKGGPLQYLGPSTSIYSSPSSSFEGTPQLSSGTSSLPTTPCDRAAVSIAGGGNPIISEPFSTRSLRVPGTLAQPGCTVHIQDRGSDELERAYEDDDDEEEEEELEGLDVDLGDMRQIPRLIDEIMPAEAERTLMRQEGHRSRCHGSSREDNDEKLLCLPMAEELQRHENPPPRKLYSSWREVAAEQDHLRQV
ncbi:hypothetical protein FIBSPDRAFT_847037, partial [Athelia psychrophila]